MSGYIRLGIEEGATLLAGGADKPSDLPAHLKAGNFLRPTVLADVDNRMRVAQEEIFGPVACAIKFKSTDDVIEMANASEYGLAGAVWTQDAGKAQRIARALRHGTVWINDFHPYLPQAEWGGFKQSGFGRELGPLGMDEFVNKQMYFVQD